jgi:1,4-dihydroxy-2-naphthoyl-CoA hydrolase
MRIWHQTIDLVLLNKLNEKTLGEFLEIEFIEIGDDFIKATMPVNQKTKQPFGLLHGGASLALAETVGSVASWCLINRDLFIGVGTEINASHLKPVTEGKVTATCTPIKVTGKLHLWQIEIRNNDYELCCVSRFTCMIVQKR